MATNFGSLRQSFAERLLSRKYYSEDDSFIIHEGCLRRLFRITRERLSKWWRDVKGTATSAYEMGRSDPRKLVFAAKMGSALSLVSVLIFFKEPLSYLGQYSIWAILTVVVFEFSIGATLNKGFNRALGTFSAGALALGIAQLSQMAGELQEVVIVISIFIAGCVKMYLECVEYTIIPSKILLYQASDDLLYKGYRAAVESTSQEESLLGFAVWEPPHGRYKMFNYPWSEYVKVSGALRHCAFMVMAMHGSILSEIQASSELRQVFKDGIQRVGTQGAKVLRQLGEKVEKMEKLSPTANLLQEVHAAAEDLQMMIDQKSYFLVNAESWENEKRPGKFADPELLQELKDNENNKPLMNSLSESANLKSTHTLRNFYPQSVNISVSQWGSGEDVLRQQTMWPSRLSLNGETILNEREVRTYKSASALSLATFTSLLIEFVARLQNLVNSFEEMSEKARFREVMDSSETK